MLGDYEHQCFQDLPQQWENHWFILTFLLDLQSQQSFKIVWPRTIFSFWWTFGSNPVVRCHFFCLISLIISLQIFQIPKFLLLNHQIYCYVYERIFFFFFFFLQSIYLRVFLYFHVNFHQLPCYQSGNNRTFKSSLWCLVFFPYTSGNMEAVHSLRTEIEKLLKVDLKQIIQNPANSVCTSVECPAWKIN